MKDYFSEEEYSCRCGCGLGKKDITQGFQGMLNQLRHDCGFPINMTCSVRCEPHNVEIGGAKKSTHLPDSGVDASDLAFANKTRFTIALFLIFEMGFTGIGIDFKRLMIHVDNRVNKAVWGY